ncbi:melanocortin-2 receptor accessory protein isoform X2 [Saccopteryx leptura]|uniref:melanocortin-2 receptor accessory protein isoform X2 n=1 Tax=Saccopteryx leptura TaxID=249018 RepID=UPI00339C1E76
MANGTNASAPLYSYEYYLDYLDLIPVDENKLGAHKHSVAIAFWVSLAVFVVLLFLVLLSMSWAGSSQARNNTQHHPTCPWSLRLALPLCVQRYLLLHRAPQQTPQPRQAQPGYLMAEHMAPTSSCSSNSSRVPPPRSPQPPRAPCSSVGTSPQGDPHGLS